MYMQVQSVGVNVVIGGSLLQIMECCRSVKFKGEDRPVFWFWLGIGL